MPGLAIRRRSRSMPTRAMCGTARCKAWRRRPTSNFPLLPAENSSGNWVKVVQRVPLRVQIHVGPDDPPLSAGMSAEVSIDTHHRRTLGDLF